MTAHPLFCQKSTRNAVMSLAAVLQKQKQFIHVFNRFLGLQLYYKVNSESQSAKKTSSSKSFMLLSCFPKEMMNAPCLRLLPPSEYSERIIDVSDAAQIKCTRSHVPTPDVLFKKIWIHSTSSPDAPELAPNQSHVWVSHCSSEKKAETEHASTELADKTNHVRTTSGITICEALCGYQ